MSDQPTRPIQTRVHLPHLRAWRLWRGYSQGELSGRAGVAKSTIANLETGKVAANWVTVGKLAEALGVQRRQLVDSAPPDVAETPTQVLPPATLGDLQWASRYREAMEWPEPYRTRMLELYDMVRYGGREVELGQRIAEEHVVEADTSPPPASPPAPPEPSLRDAEDPVKKR